MNNRIEKSKVGYKFRLSERIEFDPDLEKEANLKLAQVLTLAPPGAIAAGVLDKEGHYYIHYDYV